MDDLDERPHAPGSAPDWSEWWAFDFAQPDGVAGFVRLTRWSEHAWYWAYLVVPATGLVVVRDHELAVPRGSALTVRGEGIWSELLCETPFEHWGIALEAFGLRVDVGTTDHEVGDRVPVGIDLEWEATDAPAVVEADERTGYHQLGRVHGELLLGSDRVAIDAVGARAHAWGAPEWADAPPDRESPPGSVAIAVPVGPSRALVHGLGADQRWSRAARSL